MDNVLTPASVRKLPDGKHADGKYLYLVVRGENRSWVVRGPRMAGKRQELGLGSVNHVSLAQARRKRDDLLAAWQDGRDPLDERRQAAATAAKVRTFAQVAAQVIQKNVGGWTVNDLLGRSSTLGRWKRDLEVVCKPIATLPVGQIGLDDIKPIIMPYFDAKHDVAANLLRRRIESVLDYAAAHGLRTAGNPATAKIWKELAPKRRKVEADHHAAVEWQEVPSALARIRASDCIAARLTEFVILTVARSQEARGARWSEIDFDRKVWTVPGARMKMGREHEVPLSDAAIELLRRMEERKTGELVFLGGRGERGAEPRPMLHQSLWAFVERTTGATVHGFRSAFKDWADTNGVDDRLSEKCLAHQDKNAVRRAYARDQLTEPRRPIMEAWARFVDGDTSDNVVPFRKVG